MQLPKYIAHRGASAYAPENTLGAMRKAKELGASWVEFDVQLTKDDEVIVIHDETVNRTTNGKGEVKSFTLEDIQKLDAGDGEKIPTFVEMIKNLKTLSLNANVELKSSEGEELIVCKKVIAILDEYWPSSLAQPLLSSFSHKIIMTLKKIDCAYPIAALMHEWNDGWLSYAKEIEPISINVNQEILTQERVQAIKSEGYDMLSYTVNTVERANELFVWGLDGIFTDHIDLFA
jgi:glycerophosphoryl diester phosphodiesterase